MLSFIFTLLSGIYRVIWLNLFPHKIASSVTAGAGSVCSITAPVPSSDSGMGVLPGKSQLGGDFCYVGQNLYWISSGSCRGPKLLLSISINQSNSSLSFSILSIFDPFSYFPPCYIHLILWMLFTELSVFIKGLPLPALCLWELVGRGWGRESMGRGEEDGGEGAIRRSCPGVWVGLCYSLQGIPSSRAVPQSTGSHTRRSFSGGHFSTLGTHKVIWMASSIFLGMVLNDTTLGS